MKTVKLFSAILFVALVVTGCRSSEPFDKITRAATPEAFNHVMPKSARGVATVYDDAGYYIVFDDDNKVASLTISNLRVPGSSTPRTLTFVDVPMDYTRNNHRIERMISQEQLVSHDPVNSGTIISDVTIVYVQSNSLDPNPSDGIYARFTIDDAYVVTAYPYGIFADGTTRIDDLGSMTTAYDYTATYRLTFDPATMTATMTIDDIEIGGTAGKIVFSGLKLTLTNDGYELAFTDTSAMKSDLAISELTAFKATADLRTELDIDLSLRMSDGGSYRIAAFLSPDMTR